MEAKELRHPIVTKWSTPLLKEHDPTMSNRSTQQNLPWVSPIAKMDQEKGKSNSVLSVCEFVLRSVEERLKATICNGIEMKSV